MFLKCSTRRKDGKIHRSWSIVECRRVGPRVLHHHVLYLGEVTDQQRVSWERAVHVIDETNGQGRQLVLIPAAEPAPTAPLLAPASAFAPASAPVPALLGTSSSSAATGATLTAAEVDALPVRLSALRLERPRQWGACWLADALWRELRLDKFFSALLGGTREGTDWEKVLRTLTIYRLLSPGSEWRLHRHWFATTALPDLLAADESLAQPTTLYRCHDLLLAHKEALFAHLRARWSDLFAASYDILLYDLTSTYFECDQPEAETDPRKFGYSRDRRSDCVQVVIALVVTPEGLPLAYEMMPGNTADKTTLTAMIALLKKRHGAIGRIWVMDRGIPTEAALAQMRACDPPMHYLVGTPKARLHRLEAQFAAQPWVEVRGQLRVKAVTEDGEVYVLTESPARIAKERAMRRRTLKIYWQRLGELAQLKKCPRDELLLKLGQAKGEAGASARLVTVEVSAPGALTYQLDRAKLREVRRREGRYLLRTNLADYDPDVLWRYYMQLVFVEEAFRTLKGDLGLRPIFHQKPARIEAHLFVAFLAYCLSITLRQKLRRHAPGLMPRAVLEKLATLQLLDVCIPTTDGRELLLVRRTEPAIAVQLLLHQLDLTLPPQPPPKITAPLKTAEPGRIV